MAVDTIIIGAAAIARAISGVAQSHDELPEGFSELPAVVIFPDTGDVEYPRKPGLRQMDHALKMLLFVSRGDLPQADKTARPLIDLFIRTFDAHLTLNGSAVTSGITKYRYGRLEWAGVPYVGAEFTLRAVEREVGNYAP